jgi:hypothetical protein
MAINLVVQSGQVKNLALRYAADGKPELRFTLIQQEGTWPLYLPCCAVGAAAERLASEIDADMPIVISSGRLCYRKRANKSGVEASRMEILVWSVDRLTTLPQEERSPHAEGGGAVHRTGNASRAHATTPTITQRRACGWLCYESELERQP